MKYAKYKKEYRFKDLKNDKEFRKKYSDSLRYSQFYPQTYYCWLADKCDVVFFKRPLVITDDNTSVHSVVIKTDTEESAKFIVRNITEKELKRIFNKCNSIIL